MNYIPEDCQKVETFRERAIRLLQEKAAREQTRKLSCSSVINDPLCPHAHLLKACFGSVENAIRAAGLYPTRPNKDDAIRSLREFYNEYQRSPRTAEASTGMLVYGRGVYERLFGSWNAALKAAGLPVTEPVGGREKTVTDSKSVAEAIVIIRELYGESGILPTTDEHNRRHPEYSATFFIRRVGKWSRLAELSGLRLQSVCFPRSYSKPTLPQPGRAAS